MSNKKRPTKPRPWTPMQRAVPVDPATFSRTEGDKAQMWKNDRYTVIVAPYDPNQSEGFDGMVWLSIRRNDRKAIRDWRHFQWIKNETCGVEREAFEMFPKESRLVDSANQYHLFVLPTGQDLGIGWNMGRVTTDEVGSLSIDGEALDDDEIQKSYEDLGVSEEHVLKAQQRVGVDPDLQSVTPVV